jgi:hypothetical protein
MLRDVIISSIGAIRSCTINDSLCWSIINWVSATDPFAETVMTGTDNLPLLLHIKQAGGYFGPQNLYL